MNDLFYARRFTAVLMLLDTPAEDGRVVHGWPREWNGADYVPLFPAVPVRTAGPDGPSKVGRLETVVRVGKIVHGFGVLILSRSRERRIFEGLNRPQADLYVLKEETAPRELAHGVRLEILEWELRAVTLGNAPAWKKIPPLHYWECPL